jgi:acylpyruvate hydrolase
MRLATFLAPGSDTPRAGEVRDEDGQLRVFGYAHEQLTVLDRLADPEAAPVEGSSWRLDEVTLLAPVPAPRAIFGIGLNYADHVRETGGETPPQPLVFVKLTS